MIEHHIIVVHIFDFALKQQWEHVSFRYNNTRDRSLYRNVCNLNDFDTIVAILVAVVTIGRIFII